MIKILEINGFIVNEETPEILEELEAELEDFVQLHCWDRLEKGDRIIEVHDTCVSVGAGTPEQRFEPITTVRIIEIARVNAKTYSYKHIDGYKTSTSGKLIKGYVFNEARTGPNGFIDARRYFVI